MLPFDKHICEYRIHCPTCRDLEGGREWRRRVSVAFNVPQPAPDWECPRGMEWGDTAILQSPPIPISPPPPPVSRELLDAVSGNGYWRSLSAAVRERGTPELRARLDAYLARYAAFDAVETAPRCKCNGRNYARAAILAEWRRIIGATV